MIEDLREQIESLVGQYCDGTFLDGLHNAYFIEYFGEDSKRGPQELADRLVGLFEKLLEEQ